MKLSHLTVAPHNIRQLAKSEHISHFLATFLHSHTCQCGWIVDALTNSRDKGHTRVL